jgi:hypothetical protein
VNISAEKAGDNKGNMDIEFSPEYESYIPGYKNIIVDKVQTEKPASNEKSVSEVGVAASASLFSKIFADRTVLNILILILGFVIFIIYRLRSSRIRR